MVEKSLLTLLKEDKKTFDKVANKLSNLPIFTDDDVQRIIQRAYEAKLVDEKKNISLRKGVIIIYEEYLQEEGKKRGDYEYDFIYRKASYRFNLTQRNKARFPTLEANHPEYPCRAYRDNNKKKFYYKKALKEILINASWLIKKKDAEASLKKILNVVKSCS